MKNRFSFFISLLLTIISYGASTITIAAVTPAGKVLMAVGTVSASANDENRDLQRRSNIFSGDTLLTGKDSQVQVRMNDGALIALGADTVFEIQQYHHNQKGKKDEAVLNMITGSLRTITGKLDKSGYRLTTPAATLGIRGTIFEIHVAADGTTTVVLREGGVDVSGQVGEQIKLNLAGLASIIKKGGSAGEPGPIPEDILKYLNSILPVPAGTLAQDEDGNIIITIDIDPSSILTNPATGMPPPTTTGSGQPEPPAPSPPPNGGGGGSPPGGGGGGGGA